MPASSRSRCAASTPGFPATRTFPASRPSPPPTAPASTGCWWCACSTTSVKRRSTPAFFYQWGPGTPAEAEYVTDPNWVALDSSASSVGAEGIAIFLDAAGGASFVQPSNGDPVYFPAAGADDPASITTYTVFLP